MAVDSWVPRRFAALSDRLTTHNGIVLMGATSLAALLYTKGDVGTLVVMYSINVFLTFSLSMFGMLRHTWQTRREAAALAPQGAAVHRRLPALRDDPGHHRDGEVQGGRLDHPALHRRRHRALLRHPRPLPARAPQAGAALSGREAPRRLAGPGAAPVTDRRAPTAAILVPSFGGIGIHTVLNVFRAFPSHFKNLVFVSVGVIDSGGFKGAEAVEALEASTEAMLKRYGAVATELGVPSEYRFSDRHRRGRRGREALPRRHAQLLGRDLLRRQGRLRAGALVPAAPAQRDRARDPEAPLLGGRHHGGPAGARDLNSRPVSGGPAGRMASTSRRQSAAHSGKIEDELRLLPAVIEQRPAIGRNGDRTRPQMSFIALP